MKASKGCPVIISESWIYHPLVSKREIEEWAHEYTPEIDEYEETEVEETVDWEEEYEEVVGD
jgi:hypothetical protein